MLVLRVWRHSSERGIPHLGTHIADFSSAAHAGCLVDLVKGLHFPDVDCGAFDYGNFGKGRVACG